MIERKIQTEAYWQEEFVITKQDVQSLVQLYLENQAPMTLAELSRALIDRYCQREKNLIRRSLTNGTVYRPNGTFAVGETLVFPHLDFAQGEVVDVREGNNPEYGEFQVVAVRLAKEERSFAARLGIEHKLAFPDDVSIEQMFIPSVETLYDLYGNLVADKLERQLTQNGAFVRFRDRWLAAEMLAQVHVGHLNLAEAVLDMQAKPLPTEKLLPDLDLPQEISPALKVFSLNYAMTQDERFDDVGANGQIVWGLRRWEPQEVVSTPAWFKYEPTPYDRTRLDVTHLQLEREIDDQLSGVMALPSTVDAQSLTLILSYPHRRLGSLPLTDRTGRFFPAGHVDQHTRVTFIDRHQNAEFPGWVVRGDKFVYGLGEWYKTNQVPVGAYIKLEKTGDPNCVAIDIIPRRMKREWVCTLFKNDQGGLRFQVQKSPIACEYDPKFLMQMDDQIADELWQREQERQRPLDQVIQEVFLEIAKLSSLGTVHAKTLYNGVNILRRCPPGRIFAVLFELPHFVPVDEGAWMFNENVY